SAARYLRRVRRTAGASRFGGRGRSCATHRGRCGGTGGRGVTSGEVTPPSPFTERLSAPAAALPVAGAALAPAAHAAPPQIRADRRRPSPPFPCAPHPSPLESRRSPESRRTR